MNLSLLGLASAHKGVDPAGYVRLFLALPPGSPRAADPVAMDEPRAAVQAWMRRPHRPAPP